MVPEHLERRGRERIDPRHIDGEDAVHLEDVPEPLGILRELVLQRHDLHSSGDPGILCETGGIERFDVEARFPGPVELLHPAAAEPRDGLRHGLPHP